jgi:L-lysine exporter family protein LysE/ArgO
MNHTLYLTAFLQGLALMGSLIVAIGIQNAFLLRQGIKQQAVFLSATICFFCDAFLITLGAAGLGELFASSRLLSCTAALGGAVFLFYYALRSFHSAKTTKGLNLRSAEKISRSNIALTALAVSLLNPHAILDTIVLMGGLASRYDSPARYACALGGMTASLTWFYSLAYGAKRLSPFLSRPKIWRIIDFVIGVMMLMLSLSLLKQGMEII